MKCCTRKTDQYLCQGLQQLVIFSFSTNSNTKVMVTQLWETGTVSDEDPVALEQYFLEWQDWIITPHQHKVDTPRTDGQSGEISQPFTKLGGRSSQPKMTLGLKLTILKSSHPCRNSQGIHGPGITPSLPLLQYIRMP
jgi:hypothetical protein